MVILQWGLTTQKWINIASYDRNIYPVKISEVWWLFSR